MEKEQDILARLDVLTRLVTNGQISLQARDELQQRLDTLQALVVDFYNLVNCNDYLAVSGHDDYELFRRWNQKREVLLNETRAFFGKPPLTNDQKRYW